MNVMKLLLIDDDALLRDMYAAKFTEKGDEVSVAHSSSEALSQLAKEPYDVVVMDMIMPGVTGVELIKAIKESEGGKNAQCIVLSNQGEPANIESAKQAGAAGYIIKAECIPSEVVEKIHALVS